MAARVSHNIYWRFIPGIDKPQEDLAHQLRAVTEITRRGMILVMYSVVLSGGYPNHKVLVSNTDHAFVACLASSPKDVL